MASRAGIPNKRTSRSAELFAPYLQEAIKTIKEINKESKFASDRLSAAKVILEYGLGKPIQPIGGDEDSPFRILVEYCGPGYKDQVPTETK